MKHYDKDTLIALRNEMGKLETWTQKQAVLGHKTVSVKIDHQFAIHLLIRNLIDQCLGAEK